MNASLVKDNTRSYKTKRLTFPISLQRDITDWARGTFGEPTKGALLKRLYDEIDELQCALVDEEIIGEMSDMLHLMFQLSDYMGYDLLEETAKKFEVNKKRKWKTDGKGVGQHV